MTRDPTQLSQRKFDVLVIGGGIYGAWTAYDAQLRGLKVALVERDDWASGTSQASSKLIHGGLRYLERLEIGLVRRSLGERHRLCRIAPHRIDPLRFVVPVYRGDRVGATRLRLGLYLYDALGGSGAPFARSSRLSPAAVAARFPALRREGLTAGLTYHDAVTDDARLTLEVVAGAIAAGAVAVNHAPVESLQRDPTGRVTGAVVRDDLSVKPSFPIEAAVTVVAAGAWSGSLIGAGAPPVRTTRGSHLVLPDLGLDHAVLRMARSDGRVYFLIPWCGRTLIGTTDIDHPGDPDHLTAPDADVDYLLREASATLERAVTRSDVIASFAGLRVLAGETTGRPSAASRDWSLHEPKPGLLAPVGGKLTSARADAAHIVDRLQERLGRPHLPSPTAAQPTPWAPPGNAIDWLTTTAAAGERQGLDAATARSAVHRHGTNVTALLQRIRQRPELARRITPEVALCRAEIPHAVEHEMARTLDDVLRRRVPLLLLARPEADWIRDAATLVGEALDWDHERTRRAIATAMSKSVGQC